MRFVLVAIAFLMFSSDAFAAECRASEYGFDACPNDVSHFLSLLEKCQKEPGSPLCRSTGCTYDDLMAKYHGREKMVQMIQTSMEDILGKGAEFNTQCK